LNVGPVVTSDVNYNHLHWTTLA